MSDFKMEQFVFASGHISADRFFFWDLINRSCSVFVKFTHMIVQLLPEHSAFPEFNFIFTYCEAVDRERFLLQDGENTSSMICQQGSFARAYPPPRTTGTARSPMASMRTICSRRNIFNCFLQLESKAALVYHLVPKANLERNVIHISCSG